MSCGRNPSAILLALTPATRAHLVETVMFAAWILTPGRG